MSGNAAQEITALLSDSISKAEQMAASSQEKIEKLIDDGSRETEQGSQIARDCAETLAQIENGTREVNGRLEMIKSASTEQSSGVTEVTKALAQIDEGTQQNATASHEVAEASGEVAEQADKLQRCIDSLNDVIRGQRRSA
jgi:methyl-accepting chemotaxis protein